MFFQLVRLKIENVKIYIFHKSRLIFKIRRREVINERRSVFLKSFPAFKGQLRYSLVYGKLNLNVPPA